MAKHDSRPGYGPIALDCPVTGSASDPDSVVL